MLNDPQHVGLCHQRLTVNKLLAVQVCHRKLTVKRPINKAQHQLPAECHLACKLATHTVDPVVGSLPTTVHTCLSMHGLLMPNILTMQLLLILSNTVPQLGLTSDHTIPTHKFRWDGVKFNLNGTTGSGT